MRKSEQDADIANSIGKMTSETYVNYVIYFLKLLDILRSRIALNDIKNIFATAF